MVFKRCKYKGCATSPNCDHPHWIQVMHKGRKERGPVSKYLWLLATEANPTPEVPTKPKALADLEALVKGRLVLGQSCDPPTPTPSSSPSPLGPVPGRKRLHDAIEEYRKAWGKTAKDKSAKSVLNKIQGAKSHKDAAVDLLVDRAALREFLGDVEEATSRATRNRYFARWSHLLTWCRAEYRERNAAGAFVPMYGLDAPSPFYHKQLNPTGVRKYKEHGRDRGLEAHEEAALVAALEAYGDGGMMLGRFYCALDAALRRGEMLALRKKDIEWVGDVPVSFKLKGPTTKSGDDRIVPIMSDRLREFVKTRRFSDYTFGQLDGTVVETFRSDWEAILLASGLEAGEWETRRKTAKGAGYSHWKRTLDADLHWHDLRHVCATRLHARGVTLREIQVLLGHASIKTTETYLNVKPKGLAESMAAAAKLMGLAKGA